MKKKKVLKRSKKVYGRTPERTVEMAFRTVHGGVVRYPVDDFTN